MPSNWNEDNSVIRYSSSDVSWATLEATYPIFPESLPVNLLFLNISPMREVVVVLPFVPVTAIIGASEIK